MIQTSCFYSLNIMHCRGLFFKMLKHPYVSGTPLHPTIPCHIIVCMCFHEPTFIVHFLEIHLSNFWFKLQLVNIVYLYFLKGYG